MNFLSKKKPFLVKCRELMPEVLAAYGGTSGGQRSEADLQPPNCNPQTAIIAVFGDVHANLEALEAVLADARQQGVTQFACTGDLVGYGSNPSECLETVKQLGCPVVKGNHDEYSATDCSLNEFSLNAMNALLWTREHLSTEERNWLDELPMEWGEGIGHEALGMSGDWVQKQSGSSASASGEELAAKERREREEKSRLTAHDSRLTFHLVHSSVFEPESWKYIIKQVEAEKVLPLQKPDLVFFGHTHVPSAYAFHPDTGEFKSTVPSPEGLLELQPEWKWLINPGSVGQPRDHDPRAAYIIYDPEARTIEQRRVEYDFRKTAKKIIKVGLPERNAQRLYKGR